MLDNVAEKMTFIRSIITGDETRIYECDVETVKQNSLMVMKAHRGV